MDPVSKKTTIILVLAAASLVYSALWSAYWFFGLAAAGTMVLCEPNRAIAITEMVLSLAMAGCGIAALCILLKRRR